MDTSPPPSFSAPPSHSKAPPASSGAPRSVHMSDKQFSDLPLTAESQRALSEVLGFNQMTKVQDATLPVILKGGDVMAKAKTGTGAFRPLHPISHPQFLPVLFP